jgi:MFS family permease
MAITDAVEKCSLRSGQGRWLLAATLIASGTVFLMGSVVNIALPTIQSYFQTSVAGIQWVVNAQLLPLASLLLIGGLLGDRYGRKRIFMLGMIIFAAGAVLSVTAAGTIGLLIAFQAVMGIGAALMVPQSLALINACFEEREGSGHRPLGGPLRRHRRTGALAGWLDC